MDRWTRRRWCATVGAAALASLFRGCEQRGPDCIEPNVHDPILDRAQLWLWEQQGDDGGWHSENYAPLRGGRALSPLVLQALSRVAYVEGPPADRHARAIEFLRDGVSGSGVVGADDPDLLEYPTYATALTLHVLAALDNPGDRLLVVRMRRWLAAQQCCEATGFEPSHTCYGGWGFGGPRPLGNAAGHIDLAHTRRALEALRAAKHDDTATFARAERFLRLLQKHPGENRPQPSSREAARPAGWRAPYDGGFYFSPVVHAANKGGEPLDDGQPYFASYATATCEGALALAACGVPHDDERIRAAVGWLERHPRLDLPQGALNDGDTRWADSIRYDHFAVRAECHAALNRPGDWRGDLRSVVAPLQRADGSFANETGFLMKEDDPILCTALAITALST